MTTKFIITRYNCCSSWLPLCPLPASLIACMWLYHDWKFAHAHNCSYLLVLTIGTKTSALLMNVECSASLYRRKLLQQWGSVLLVVQCSVVLMCWWSCECWYRMW
jgi:hypothetical protein